MAEAWCGRRLEGRRFFGVRRNLRGAALESHIDHDPMERAIGVSITVDVEGLEMPWLLQVAGDAGGVGNAAVPPGSCLVYEASRVRHFRSSPLRAECYANAFAHYSVVDWE